jgi:iron(III) transport system substrate-binding protein
MIVNKALMMGIAPLLVTKLVVATFLFESMHVWFDGRAMLWPEVPTWCIATVFTVSLFLLDDVTKYLVHRCLHQSSFLWCFHKIHHSAQVLTPFTVYRTHPVEGIVFGLRSIFLQAIATAVFFYFFGERAELITILGVNAGLFVFNAAGANLRHSHVWISYGKFIENFLISPAQHQVHHSAEPKHHNCNFGVVLAVWDWMGGSLYHADSQSPRQFGLGDGSENVHDLSTIYLTPIIESMRCLFWTLEKVIKKMSVQIINKSVQKTAIGGLVLLACLFGYELSAGASELNIYSHRQPFLINPFIEAYQARTGVKVNIVYASKGLAQRLQAEGERSPADVILTVDMARLNVYVDKGLLASVQSKVLLENVPAHLRDPGNRWFSFSKRARVIVLSLKSKDTAKIKKYEDLMDPKWKGRICVRPGSHVYNRALVASLIYAGGTDTAENWASGLIKNLARRPQGNDRAQVKAMYEGVCDIALINNYYFGKLKYSNKKEQRKWAAAVRLVFPNQKGRGAHINISGGGVAKHSKNKKEAIRFLEFLTSREAQNLYGSINFEYPVNPNVEVPKELQSWGNFKEDKMPISQIAKLAPDAQKVIDRVGW